MIQFINRSKNKSSNTKQHKELQFIHKYLSECKSFSERKKHHGILRCFSLYTIEYNYSFVSYFDINTSVCTLSITCWITPTIIMIPEPEIITGIDHTCVAKSCTNGI